MTGPGTPRYSWVVTPSRSAEPRYAPVPPGDPAGAERELLGRVRAGDASAFDEICRAHVGTLVSYLEASRAVESRAAAEDVVHDVLLAMWTGRRALAIQGTLRGYLFGAVRRRAADVRRRSIRERLRVRSSPSTAAHPSVAPIDLDVPGLAAPAVPPDVAAQAADTSRVVAMAVCALPPRQREAFHLRVGEGLAFAEVANVMGVSVRTAETNYLRAVTALRVRLAGRWP